MQLELHVASLSVLTQSGHDYQPALGHLAAAAEHVQASLGWPHAEHVLSQAEP